MASCLIGSVPKPSQAQSSGINPSPPSVRRPDLELGRQGGAVAELQAVLKLLGFYTGEVSGTYDDATSLAVGRFQEAAKLPQTGRVSTQTWNALFPLDTPSSVIATAPASPPPPAAPTSSPTTPKPTITPKPTAPKPTAPKPTTPKPTVPTTAPKPAPKPAPRPEPRSTPYPTLKKGQKGDAVMRLQRLLIQKGFLQGQPDGAFGPMTEAAVEAAQEALDLEIDGVVGPATWQALLK